MSLTSWKQKIADSVIMTIDDGRLVFYPYGPFKGYLLPKTAFEPIIITTILRFNITAFVSFVVTAGVGKILNVSMDILLLVGLIDYVHYYWRIRRITRKLIALPRDLSIRVYAYSDGPERLWERFVSITFMLLLFAVLALWAPGRALFWVILALMFLWAGIIAYVITVQRRESSRKVRPFTKQEKTT